MTKEEIQALELLLELADWANIRKFSTSDQYAAQNKAIAVVEAMVEEMK